MCGKPWAFRTKALIFFSSARLNLADENPINEIGKAEPFRRSAAKPSV